MQQADWVGVVVAAPTSANQQFEVETQGQRRWYSRGQLRLVRDETQDKYREDLGYGRGQRERREVAREKLVRARGWRWRCAPLLLCSCRCSRLSVPYGAALDGVQRGQVLDGG